MIKIRGLPGILLLLATVGLLAGCGGRPGALAGQVMDAEGKAVPEMLVAVYGLESSGSAGNVDVFQKGERLQDQLTGADGAFAFDLPPGKYIVELWQAGEKTDSRMVEVKAGQTASVEFQVESPSP